MWSRSYCSPAACPGLTAALGLRKRTRSQPGLSLYSTSPCRCPKDTRPVFVRKWARGDLFFLYLATTVPPMSATEMKLMPATSFGTEVRKTRTRQSWTNYAVCLRHNSYNLKNRFVCRPPHMVSHSSVVDNRDGTNCWWIIDYQN